MIAVWLQVYLWGVLGSLLLVLLTGKACTWVGDVRAERYSENYRWEMGIEHIFWAVVTCLFSFFGLGCWALFNLLEGGFDNWLTELARKAKTIEVPRVLKLQDILFRPKFKVSLEKVKETE